MFTIKKRKEKLLKNTKHTENHYQKMRRPSDSVLTLILARSVSTRLTPLFAKTSITPLQVTLAGLLIALLAAWQASWPSWTNHLIAAFLLEFSHILDCVDGELARLTNRGNPFAAALDPITDRIKDIVLIFASFIQAIRDPIFNWSEFDLFILSFFSVGFWSLYMYIVDAYLNPNQTINRLSKKTYLGLYDLFIYGAIGFLILDIFNFFVLYVIVMAIVGVAIQIIRLQNLIK